MLRKIVFAIKKCPQITKKPLPGLVGTCSVKAYLGIHVPSRFYYLHKHYIKDAYTNKYVSLNFCLHCFCATFSFFD